MKRRFGPGRPVNTHFDWLAPIYDRFAPPARLDTLRELLRPPLAGRLLDAGGGTGRVSSPLRSLFRQVVVLDLSRAMLKQSRRKHGLVPIQADAGQLPFPDDIFDRILIVDSLHHFAGQQAVICELMRVLRPGGLLVIEEFNINRFPIKLLALLERALLMGSNFSTRDRIREMLTACGAASITCTQNSFSIWITGEKPSGHEL
jgi:ubiquinone/menaquinone biosynthesis C-methylase UbiE